LAKFRPDHLWEQQTLNFSDVLKHAFLSVLLLSAAVSADDKADDKADLAELLRQHTHSVALEDAALTGPGADLILELADGTQFVAMGEEHYNFYIPDIATALFTALHERYGYRYFMTEQDPVMMEAFSRAPVRGDVQKVNALAQTYPMGVTFNSDQELKMLADLGRISSTEGDVIWGCDQGSGVTHTLDQLLEELQDEKAIAAVQDFRQLSAEKEAVRDFSNGHFIYDTDVEDFIRLKEQVNAGKGSRAEWLLDVLINSSKIFGFYKNGNQDILPGYYENNRFREEHLIDLCLAKYHAAEALESLPKALMKFGSWHIYEGLSPTGVHTIGDFFSNVARLNDQRFLSIHFISRPEDPEESMGDLGFIWPFIRDLNPDEFVVIDLRPFRSYPNRNLFGNTEGEEWNRDHKENFFRLVYGYDLIFFTGQTKAATFEVVPEPE
jgi:hypothetical protein